MTHSPAFVTHGIAQAQRALSGVAVMTRAHLNPATLERHRKAGEARPFVLAMPRTHRVPPELGAIATALRLPEGEGSRT